jgi:hypothetical protein
MEIKLNPKFKKNVEGIFGKYSFEVGVLQDGEHLKPKRGVRGLKGQDVLSSYAGGPIRQKSSESSGMMISDVSAALRERLGVNYLLKPFKDKSSDIIKFSTEFFKLCFGKTQPKRLENLLQAIVRNPMLRGDYGPNSKITKKIKGFDRATIDTAQLFRSITAAVKGTGK